MTARPMVWLPLVLGLTGCASVNLSTGYPDVSAKIEERAAAQIAWSQGVELDQEAAERLRSLLQRKLTADDAVQIALLNNRDLQAMYSDLHTFLGSILDRNDRMTMGASIECRVPFLDYRLVEMLAALPSSVLLAGKRNKHVLRQAVGDRLPEAVTQGR